MSGSSSRVMKFSGIMPSSTGRGTFAEFVCAREKLIALKPANLTFEQAAAVPLAAMTALQGLRDKGNIQPGQKVLIQGASGGVGTFAVQIAKALGLKSPRCAARGTWKWCVPLGQIMSSITRRRFHPKRAAVRPDPGCERIPSLSDYLRALKPEGIYVVAGVPWLQLIQAASNRKKISKPGPENICPSLEQSQEDLIIIKELLESGKIMPVIDGCYPLSKTPEAFWYFEKEHPRGKVVISVV